MSGTWKIWSPGGMKKSDVYVASRALGFALKTSLHESGIWHTAFNTTFVASEVESGHRLHENRFVEKWPAPAEIAPGLLRCFQLLIPTAAVTLPTSSEHSSAIDWIPAAPPGMATEISVMLLHAGVRCSRWPGAARGFEPIGSFVLASKGTVWCVYQYVPVPRLSPATGTATAFKSARAANAAEGELRIVVFGSDESGGRFAIESIVQPAGGGAGG